MSELGPAAARMARIAMLVLGMASSCAGAAPRAPSETTRSPAPVTARPSVPASFDPGPLDVGRHRFERRVLANGLQALAARDSSDHTGRVSVFVVSGVGKRMEGSLTSGIAHLTEHAMYAGTRRWPAGEHDSLIHALGGESNAFTRQDVTIYYDSRIPSARLDLVLVHEADRMRGLTFEPAAFAHEQQRLADEERATDSEATRRDELLESLVFRVHPYGAGVLDSEGHTLAPQLTREQTRQFYDLWYRPEHAAIVVAGDVDPETALAAVETAFEAVPSGPPAPPIPREPDDAPGGSAVVRSATLTRSRVSFAWVGPALDEGEDGIRDRTALELLAAALGHQRTGGRSRLDARSGSGVDRDLFVVSSTGGGARERVAAALRDVRSNGLPVGALEREKKLALREMDREPLLAERPYFSLAGEVASAAALAMPDLLARRAELVRAVTPETVRDAARRWLDAAHPWVVTFEPDDPAAASRPLPEDPLELQHIAEEATASGELDRAIAAYEKLLLHNPGKMWTVIYLYEAASVRVRAGDLTGARHDLERGLALVDYPALRELLDEVDELAGRAPATGDDN